LALIARGHDVDVFEQAPELKEVGAGVQISPNGNRALHALGVFEAMQRLSCTTAGKSPAVEHRQDLEPVRPRHGGDRALRFSLCHGVSPDLLQVLADARACGQADAIHLGRRAIGCTQQGGRVTCISKTAAARKATADRRRWVSIRASRHALFGGDRPRFFGK